jgi:hypothetical protein
MADTRLSVRERVRSADYLAWLAGEANKAAAWLSEQGCETEADKAELAAVHLMAVVALLERPIRPTLPPERWQAADGYPPR